MAKYRIIEVLRPELEKCNGTVDFMPEIIRRKHYIVQQLDFDFFPFKQWTNIFITDYFERAELQIKFLKSEEQIKVLKEY